MGTLLIATSGGTIVGMAIFVLVFSVVAFLWGSAQTKLNEAGLKAGEAELGLQRIAHQRWRGVIDGFEVNISLLPTTSKKERLQRTRVTVGGALPAYVSLGKEGFVASLSGQGLGEVYGSDLRVGDPTFDAATVVKGERDKVLALLDAELRELVMAAIGEGWVFVERCWQYTATGPPSPQDFTRARRALELAAAVRSRVGSVLPRLVERAMNDPARGVRLGALEALLETYRDAPESARAFEHAQRSDEPEHRLVVSRALADRADLAAFVRDADLPTALRVAALDAVVRLDPAHPEAHALCRDTLDAPPELRLRAVQAIAAGRHPDAEALLLTCLEDLDEAVIGVAVAGLGAIGTAAAVPALRELGERRLRRATNDAIAQIQARIGATAGSLAVAEADGALAFAEEDVLPSS